MEKPTEVMYINNELTIEKNLDLFELEQLAAVGGSDASDIAEPNISALACISAISVLTCTWVSATVSVVAGCGS